MGPEDERGMAGVRNGARVFGLGIAWSQVSLIRISTSDMSGGETDCPFSSMATEAPVVILSLILHPGGCRYDI